ncbi:MAG: SDR family NAD(P)-dependent oxidoreductase [Candidatus Neomarinimicrobiota bacterium]
MSKQGGTALVTGASRGIGRYIARTLARKGYNLALVARSKSGLAQTKEESAGFGTKIWTFPFDLLEIKKIGELYLEIINLVGNLDVIVNNAGIEIYRRFQDFSTEEISNIINLNLLAPMELTRKVLPRMLNRDYGRIINIASLGGKKGEAFNSPYTASKAGLIMWSDSLRQELHGTGVKVVVICPGFIAEAGMFHDIRGEVPPLLGTSSPQAVADAVIAGLKGNRPEIIVNQGPMKPLLALGQISPALGDRIVRWFKVPDLSRKRINSKSGKPA